MSINLTRINSRKKGAGKTTILTAAAIGHCVMKPEGIVWLVTSTESMVEYALHQLCSETGMMPKNLRVTDEITFSKMLLHPSHSLGGTDEARAMDHVFYDSLDQKRRNIILDGLISTSERIRRTIYVTIAEN